MTILPPAIDIKPFLDEDIGAGDITAAIIPAETSAVAKVITREAMILCGKPWFDAVFEHLDSNVNITWYANEGDGLQAGANLQCTDHPKPDPGNLLWHQPRTELYR